MRGLSGALLEPRHVFHSARTQPILVVDPQVDLGRGLWHQLTRHGVRADLAITIAAAQNCVGCKDYYSMIAIADLSHLDSLADWRQLREAAPRTWMIVVASKTGRVESDLGGDVCLPVPFRFSDLLRELASRAYVRGRSND